jgi:hypothetical protein
MEIEELYNEIYKTLKKEIKEDTRRRKDLLNQWSGRINIVRKGYTTKSNLKI